MGFFKRKAIFLQYQNISEDTDNFLETWIYHKSFEEQLDYLSKNNVPIIPLDDAVAYLKRETKLHKQSFSITFDTGFTELYTLCFPLLKKYGFPATFFIRPDTVGKAGIISERHVSYMDWDQIRELADNDMTIGLYGCKGNKLTPESLDEVREEIKESKLLFERELKRKVIYYGVREGVPSKPMVKLFKKEDIRAVLCETPTKQRTHPYAVGRIQIDDNDFNIFLVKLSRVYIFFKDSRFWKYIRKYKIDKVAHLISNMINKIRGIETY